MASGTNSDAGSAICTMPGVANKPIRVDNWGNFLAQRIEALYDKQEHCDLTLRFPHGDLKTHSLILHACTPFFTNLLKGKTTGHKILKMPPQISPTDMDIILKFVYTGRLEAPFSINMLYDTAKLLKLQVLVRLLEAQMSSTEASVSAGHLASSPSRRGRPPFGYHRPRPPGSGTGYHPTNSQLAAKRTPVRAADPPGDVRPSRFELPDSEVRQLRLPVLESGLLHPKSELRADQQSDTLEVAPAGREALFDHLRHIPAKRAESLQQNSAQKRLKLEPPDPERDATVLREYCQQQQLRAELLDERDGGLAESDDEPPLDSDWQDQEVVPDKSPSAPLMPRSILRQESTPAGTSCGKKRVQFSDSQQLTLTVQDMGDTSELLSQLLKQHPQVLRGGQNVKVRLVTQAGSSSPSRTDFMVVKQLRPPVVKSAGTQRSQAGGTPETLDAPLSCSLCAQKGRQVDFRWTNQMAKHFRDEHGDTSLIDLNTLACTACVQAGDPIEFVSATDYFTHMRDVHDARGINSAGSCQLCGFSANKKLQLIYHQYVKHKIRPPRFITFPKCDRCDFEAISDSEMAQHRQRRHKIGKEYRCKDCGLTYQNLNLLEGHMRTNACRQRSDEKRKFDWKCEFCGMSFSRNYNLKAHIRSVHKMSVDHHRMAREPGEPLPALRQEATASAISTSLDPSSEAESMSTVANSVAASLSLAADDEYMTLPGGIVPVEDENGTISYIALQSATGGSDGGRGVDSDRVSDRAVLELAQYTVPVVVSGGAGAVTIQVAAAVGGHGPGASAGETVLPDLAALSPRPQLIDLPQATGPEISRTPVSVQQLQTSWTARRAVSQSNTLRAERRPPAGAGPSTCSSRISVSSSEVTVSDLAEPGSILPHLPGESLPAAASQHYVAQLQPGKIVVADGMSAGHVIVSELTVGQEMILADMTQGHLYELQSAADQPIELDGAGRRLPAEVSPRVVRPRDRTSLSQPTVPGVSQAQDVTTCLSQNDRDSVPNQDRVGVTEILGSDVNEAVAQEGPDVTDDVQIVTPTKEAMLAGLSHADQFIGPDGLPDDPGTSDVRLVQARCNSETEKRDVGESGTLRSKKGDLSVKLCDQSSDRSETDVSASERHSAVNENIARCPPSQDAVCQEQMNSEIDDSEAHCHPGKENIASDEQDSTVKAERLSHQPDDDTALCSDCPGTSGR